MKSIQALIVLLFAVSGCASAPLFKTSKAYNKSFEQVWNACTKAVENESLDSATNKELHQIVTRPTNSSSYSPVAQNSESQRYTTIKISQNAPYTVSVKAVVTKKQSLTLIGSNAGTSRIDESSDTDEEKRILDRVDELLK